MGSRIDKNQVFHSENEDQQCQSKFHHRHIRRRISLDKVHLNRICELVSSSAMQSGHETDSRATPFRIKLDLVGRQSRRARHIKMLIFIGIAFTHLVASEYEGRVKSSMTFRTSLTRKDPSLANEQTQRSGIGEIDTEANNELCPLEQPSETKQPNQNSFSQQHKLDCSSREQTNAGKQPERVYLPSIDRTVVLLLVMDVHVRL
ncbi:hypothetical protein Tco_1431025 [Tanacetum coccineum]